MGLIAQKPLVRLILMIIASVLAAFFAALPFPSPFSEGGFSFLSFVSLIPMFWVIGKSKWHEIPFVGIAYGFFFYLIYNYWLKTFHPLAILLAPILESVQYLMLFPFLKMTSKLFKKRAYILTSLAYVSYLYMTQQGFLAYPYGNISAALYRFPAFIQIVEITGIWGVCMLLAFPQAMVAEMLLRKDLKSLRKDFLIVLIILISNCVIGTFRIRAVESEKPDRILRIAAVQHSADTWIGGDAAYRRNFETMRRLSLEALEEKPDMVVWSETAFVPSVPWNILYPFSSARTKLAHEFLDFASSIPAAFVTGNPNSVIDDETKGPYLEDGTWNNKEYNSVLFFADGKEQGRYRKQHLVPFTEHFPYKKQMPHLAAFLEANDYHWWEKGDEPTVFHYDGYSFSTPICFEDTFGVLSANFVDNGADFILNLTNDVWSKSIPAEVQHFQLAAFRAIENRRPLIRSTNSGITCMVLPSGKIVGELEPFTESWNVYDVPLRINAGTTFYTRHPDFFAKLFIALTFLGVALGAIARIDGKVRERRERVARLASMFETIPEENLN